MDDRSRKDIPLRVRINGLGVPEGRLLLPGRIKRLKVADIEPMEVETETESFSAEDLWREPSIEYLATEQQITAPQHLDALIGAGADLWKDERDLESFVADIYRRRREDRGGEGNGR